MVRMPQRFSAAAAGLALVAGLVGVVEVGATGALQQVAGSGRLVEQLAGSAGQETDAILLSLTAIADVSVTLPELVTAYVNGIDTPTALNEVVVVALTSDSAGDCAALIVRFVDGEVVAPDFADATLVTLPASRSACVVV